MNGVADCRLITRVALRNYKNIAACDVELRPLTILVGPNGSGKSNFLDAVRFTAQALRLSLHHAMSGARRLRGGLPSDSDATESLRCPSRLPADGSCRLVCIRRGNTRRRRLRPAPGGAPSPCRR